MRVLGWISRTLATPRTVAVLGASRTITSRKSRASPGNSGRCSKSGPRILAAGREAGSSRNCRSRVHPAGAVTSMTSRTPDAPSRSNVSAATGSGRLTSAMVGSPGNAERNCRMVSVSAGGQRWTDSSTASTGRSRTALRASGTESRTRTVKQPVLAASTWGRSVGRSTAATVGCERTGEKGTGPPEPITALK